MANFTSGFGWVIVGLFVLIGLIAGWKAGGFIAGVAGGNFERDKKSLKILIAISHLYVDFPLILILYMTTIFALSSIV
ncbi:MAG: hypothetical protein WA240_12625 [Nitrospirota bacterium]